MSPLHKNKPIVCGQLPCMACASAGWCAQRQGSQLAAATQWDTITYTGADARTKCLMIQWEDGFTPVLPLEGPLAARSLRHLYGRPVPAALPLQNSALRDMTTHTVQQTGT